MTRLDFGATVAQPIQWGAFTCALGVAVILGEAVLNGAAPKIQFVTLLALSLVIAVAARWSQNRTLSRGRRAMSLVVMVLGLATLSLPVWHCHSTCFSGVVCSPLWAEPRSPWGKAQE